MLTYPGQAILHAIIAAVVVEAVVRFWRIETPRTRLAFRLLALLLPVVALPCFMLFAPYRSEPWFAERWALFSASGWAEVRVGGIGLDVIWLAGLGGGGLGLYLMDALPALGTWLVDRVLPAADDPALAARVSGEVDALRTAGRLPAPAIRLVRSTAPVLLCGGLGTPHLVVSTGAVAILDERQLRAGIAHELAHARHRDPQLGWLLMATRTLCFFSPASQFIARSAVEDLERRADDEAVAATGDRFGMAGALVRLFTAEHAGGQISRSAGDAGIGRLASSLDLGRTAAVEHRCRRLLSPRPALPVPYWPFPLVLTGGSLVVLLFFVV